MPKPAEFLLIVLLAAATATAQERGYTFQVQVNEVTLPFRAVDAEGRPVTNLHPADLDLRDNGKEPRKILSFTHLTDQPLRIGILIDVSPSIGSDAVHRSQDIASLFMTQFFRPSSDKAFAMKFDFDQMFLSQWVSNPPEIESAVSSIGGETASRMGGTAIYDALYRGTRDMIVRQMAPGQRSNAILLFTDGYDNASHARLSDVIDISQKTNTTIYAFSVNRDSRFDEGEKNLRALVAESGGRIFHDWYAAGVRADLATVEADLRDYYLVVYRPASLKPNGAFHRIRLACLRQDVQIAARTGYTAPQPAH